MDSLRAHAQARSILHTPPVFAIYVVLLMLRWLEGEIGGLAEMARINGEKARAVYAALDAASPFYRRHAQPGFESEMNVVFQMLTTPAAATITVATAPRDGSALLAAST